MKIIEILNKLAKEEELPKIIEFKKKIYVYSVFFNDYLFFPFGKYEYIGLFDMNDILSIKFLNEEVKVLYSKDMESDENDRS